VLKLFAISPSDSEDTLNLVTAETCLPGKPNDTHLVAELDQRLGQGQGQGPETGTESCSQEH
jgi:hypothetical protein